MNTRPIRSLEHLEDTASTARVLNLRVLAIKHGRNPEYSEKPLFLNHALNTAIIVKHRLRSNEYEEFFGFRRTATKILLPIEVGDLRMGARYVFIGQKNFDLILREVFGVEMSADDRDYRTLMILDETPSLDPFLLREQLKRKGVEAAPCYFEISEADLTRMFDFCQREIQQLVEMSFGGDASMTQHAAKLARKILMNANDKDLEPLRLTMQLSPEQYEEGIFCWKAFLYYKWRLTTVLPQLNGVVSELVAVAPKGVMSSETRSEIAASKEAIRKSIVASARKVRDTLKVYDEAYEAMTKQGDPIRFRDFLLQAPRLFNELGDRLGAIDHVISFWRFRFPQGKRVLIAPEELSDIFADFEQSLSREEGH